ncbi:MAG: alpha/beta hydrolase [Chloroflexi bacterium]|nr:alpha/beta hydrolase [Chloroflexota bacterium]
MPTSSKKFASSHGSIAYTDNELEQVPVIFVHGLPTSKEIWGPVLPFLPSDIRVITYDLLDYGESEKINHSISHIERADVMDELRAHLGFDKFVLVAHDLGSSVAIDYMGKYASHIEKLVLMSPPVYPDFKEPFIVKIVRIQGVGEVLVKIFKHILLKVGILQGMVNKMRLTHELFSAISNGFAGREGDQALLRVLRWGRPFNVFKNYPRIIESIHAPTLVIQGRRDPYIPLDQATRLRDTIPNCKLILINEGSHFLPMDTPDEVGREISAFMLS